MNKNIIQKKMMNSIHLRETVDGVAEKCINSNLRDYQIFGNTVQDGEPAIDNPVEVVSVGELVNFINVSQCEDGTIMSSNGQVALIPKRVRTGYIYLKKGSYCLSTIGTENDIIFGGYCHKYSSKDITTWLGSISCSNNISVNERNYKTFTLDEDCYCRFILLPSSTSSITNLTINNISNYKPQLEVGDIPTLYKPYGIVKIPITTTNENGDSLTNIYLNEPLRKIGDAQDYIDFRSQKVYRNVRELVLTGEEKFFVVSTTTENKFYRFQMTNEQLAPSISDWTTQKCNYYIGANITTTNTNVGILVYSSVANSYTYCQVRDNDNFPTVDDFLAFLKEKYAEGNPLVIYYQSYDTIEEDIELPKLPQFKGTTIYQIATNIPSEFVGTYKTRL